MVDVGQDADIAHARSILLQYTKIRRCNALASQPGRHLHALQQPSKDCMDARVAVGYDGKHIILWGLYNILAFRRVFAGEFRTRIIIRTFFFFSFAPPPAAHSTQHTAQLKAALLRASATCSDTEWIRPLKTGVGTSRRNRARW